MNDPKDDRISIRAAGMHSDAVEPAVTEYPRVR
jgi:hypothetical protein